MDLEILAEWEWVQGESERASGKVPKVFKSWVTLRSGMSAVSSCAPPPQHAPGRVVRDGT